MRKFIPYDVFGVRRERQCQDEARRRTQRPNEEYQQMIDYWAGKGLVPIRFTGRDDVDLEALELRCGEARFVLVTARDIYELPATLQAKVSVSFHTADGRIARSCDAKNSAEAFVAITDMDNGAWLKGGDSD